MAMLNYQRVSCWITRPCQPLLGNCTSNCGSLRWIHGMRVPKASQVHQEELCILSADTTWNDTVYKYTAALLG